MQRLLNSDLKEWKNRANRKPLILRGARQVGKTWLLQNFAEENYANYVYFDFLESEHLHQIFDGDFDIDRIIRNLSIYANAEITPETLIIFDEIQECPRALTSLKYFYQKRPDLSVAAAGSYLGIAKHENESFPVGKVDTLTLFPMSFAEFLMAANNEMLAQSLLEGNVEQLSEVFSEKLAALLKEYMFCGGMPEAVAAFVDAGNYAVVRRIQNGILHDYDADFLKHMPPRVLERTRLVWSALPAQLAKENKKFVYGAVREGGRARDFEESIQWLVDYGVVVKVPRISAIKQPIDGYAKLNDFKLFCVDVGLLGAMARVDAGAILQGDALFVEFKGALTEQFVCQQLIAAGFSPYYWSAERGQAETDFVVQGASAVVPIEVKAARNVRSKSLGVACEKFGLTSAVRYSMAGYKRQENLTNLPLWAAGLLG
jgi:hypothetical protein